MLFGWFISFFPGALAVSFFMFFHSLRSFSTTVSSEKNVTAGQQLYTCPKI